MTDPFCGVILNPYCSLDCLFCNHPPARTPIKESRKALRLALANVDSLATQGYHNIEISGCDPAETEDIFALLKSIKKARFKQIMLSTNGVRLADEPFLDKIVGAGVTIVRLPIYGSNARIHDSITQTAGSYDDLIQACSTMSKRKYRGLKLIFTTLLMKQNKNDILDTVRLAAKYRPHSIHVSIPCIKRDGESFAIPYRTMRRYAKNLLSFASRSRCYVDIKDIPYCVFGTFSNLIRFSRPPNLGKYNQPPKSLRTDIKNLPSYRYKVKMKYCALCSMDPICPGFYKNYISAFGDPKLKPLQIELP